MFFVHTIIFTPGLYILRVQVVGAPCGIMDQMASNIGEEGKLLALLCRPAEIQVSEGHSSPFLILSLVNLMDRLYLSINVP